MAVGKAQNLRRGVGLIGGEVINRLNKLDDGLGTLLLREVNQRIAVLSGRIEAQAGHKGSVHIAPQGRDVSGKSKPAIVLGGQRAAGMDDPIDNEDGVNLRYFRRFLNCDWFEKMFDECIDDDGMRRAAAAEGNLPWFWGWTVQHPHETDTLMAIFSATVESSGAGLDAGQGYFYVTPFPLQESAGFTNVAFWIDTTYTPATTFPGVHDMNVGLYNTDRELVWELGPYEVFSSDGVYGPGAGRVAVDTTATSLESGEYYLAIFLPSCLRLLCVDIDQNMTSLFTTPIEQHMSKYPLDSPFEPNFPETIPDTPWDEGAELQLIPLFLFTNMDTIGFTG
jgi:hypothetical protein